MEHYVTLFDSLFLPQGLALHLSMERVVRGYKLWILCVDDEAFNILSKLQLRNVHLLQLSKLETDDLKRVKITRSKGEYCWTLTPFAPRFVFEADLKVERVTYLDADLWFRKHPGLIFDEFDASSKQVLITEHGYAPEYDQSINSGRYCVQFMTFTRGGGELVRKWWEERCIEWCYARFEDGKFGDQKYIETIYELFADDTHVLSNSELTLAPWNATRFPHGKSIFYHFHGFRVGNITLMSDGYVIPRAVIKNIYKPYVVDISTAVNMLATIGFKARSQYKVTSLISIAVRNILKVIYTVISNGITFKISLKTK